MWQARKHVCNYLNIKEDKIEIFDHHNCHAAYMDIVHRLYIRKNDN